MRQQASHHIVSRCGTQSLDLLLYDVRFVSLTEISVSADRYSLYLYARIIISLLILYNDQLLYKVRSRLNLIWHLRETLFFVNFFRVHRGKLLQQQSYNVVTVKAVSIGCEYKTNAMLLN